MKSKAEVSNNQSGQAAYSRAAVQRLLQQSRVTIAQSKQLRLDSQSLISSCQERRLEKQAILEQIKRLP